MVSIRRNTFETNSSSTHSISIINNERTECELPIEYLDYDFKWDGNSWEEDCLMVELTGFCGYDDHKSQNDRLALLCLFVCYEVMEDSPHCLNQQEWNDYFLKVYESDRWQELESEICSDVPNAKHIRVYQYSEGYIDHPEDYKDYKEFIDYWYLSDPCNYVFAKEVETHFEFNG